MKKSYLILAILFCSVSLWGQNSGGVAIKKRTGDDTVKASVTKKTTTVEYKSKNFRRGWLVGSEINLATDLYGGYGHFFEVNAGYLINHWYFGLISGYGSEDFRDETYKHFPYLCGSIRYYFGRKAWNPYVGMVLGPCGTLATEHFNYGIETSYQAGFLFRLEGGIKHYFDEHWAIHGGVALNCAVPGNGACLAFQLGVSYLF